MDELNEAVCAYADAVRESPAEIGYLEALGIALLQRIDHLGDLGDMTNCVSMMEDIVHLTPDGDPERPSRLNNLGNCFRTRFEHLGDIADMNMSIVLQEDAVRLTPNGHADKPSRLNNLGSSFITRFTCLGDLDDLNKSVVLQEDAVHLTPDGDPDKPSRLNNLGSSFATRFKRLGDLNDLNKAVVLQEDAVCLTPDGDPAKPSRLNNLGMTCRTRFKRLGDLNDLNRALMLQEEAVHLIPEGDLDRLSVLNNLGNSLFIRFEHHGDLGDINRSVSLLENSVRLTPDGHLDKVPRLNNLANVLVARFEHLGDLNDINWSVSLQEDVVHRTPNGHPNKPSRLNNLGNSFALLFERFGNPDDLNKSVMFREDAVRLTPEGHPEKPSWFNNLGDTLLARFRHLGDLNDLNRSVSLQEDAVCLTLDGQLEKPSRLNNLGNFLATRFKHLGDLDDINRSVSLQENAVCLTPEGHPDRPAYLNNLGNSFFTRYECLQNQSDLQKSIGHYSSAARSTTGPTHIKFQAATSWAQCTEVEDPLELLEAYRIALNLLPELAWLGLSISDRHYHLLKAGKVVRDAAAASIASGDPQQAVEWLEQGRSVIWGQFLSLRSPVDILEQSHPKLANELCSLSAQLEGSGTRASHPDIIQSGAHQSLQFTAQHAHENAYKRERLLKKIRALEGFEQFLLPKTMSQLFPAAQQGPVIILNVGKDHCDPLILMPGQVDHKVMHIPLPNFKPEHVEALAKSFHNLVPSSGGNDRLSGQREGSMLPEDEFAHILSELWVQLVKPVLNGLSIMTPSKVNPQRIWWCPTGPLTFLPIHAAGLYGKNEPFGSKLSDFVISSYVPSLTALIECFRPQSNSKKEPKLLAIAQPSAVGQTYIPGTQKELDHIQRLAMGKLPILRLDEDMATVESVQQGMRDSSWVHFACHGVQNLSRPTESALLLAESSCLTLSSIIRLNLPHADFAFLSACQTATGDKSLQEESVHLAAGMLLAGYRGVIATMWTIGDNDAPQVARDIYEHLFRKSSPDPTQAAEALHLAIQKLCQRSTGKSFFHWVPFIHVGV
ncbi:CHAT domain-containing protein [Mycena epipterygia]|nr:CHAT domain-containing protein [Mycena epipterygia]